MHLSIDVSAFADALCAVLIAAQCSGADCVVCSTARALQRAMLYRLTNPTTVGIYNRTAQSLQAAIIILYGYLLVPYKR